MSRSHCSPAFFNPERETENAWVPRETVNKLGSPLHCCSEARTIAWAACASPYPRARVRCSEELTMNASVGIDVSKDHLEWAQGLEGKIQQTRDQPRAIAELVRHLVSLAPTLIVVESTEATSGGSSSRSRRPACRWSWSTRDGSEASARGWGYLPRPTPSTPGSWPSSGTRSSRRFARSCRATTGFSPLSPLAAASSSHC